MEKCVFKLRAGLLSGETVSLQYYNKVVNNEHCFSPRTSLHARQKSTTCAAK